MKIYIIYQNSLNLGSASARRVLLYSRAIIASGHESEVIIPFPMIAGGRNSGVPVSGEYNGVPYVYSANMSLYSINPIRRKFQILKAYICLIKWLTTTLKKDARVHVYGFSNAVKAIIGIVCRLRHVPVSVELNEYPFCWLGEAAGVRTKRVIFFNLIMRLYNGVIVISEALHQLASRYNKGVITKIPILVDSSPDISNEAFTCPHPYIFHSGSLTEMKDGFVGMLEAFALARRKMKSDLLFFSTGNLASSPERRGIQDIIDKYNLHDCVNFLGFLTDSELVRFQKGASIFIINKYDNMQNKYCFATKLGEYMMFARPVILTDVGEIKHWFKDRVNAIVVNPGSISEMVESIEYLLTHKQQANQIGLCARQMVETCFDYRMQAESLVNHFNKL